MRTNCGFTCLMIFLQVGGVTGSNDNKIRVLCCLSDVRIKLHICSQPIYFLKKESKKKKSHKASVISVQSFTTRFKTESIVGNNILG